MTLKGQPELGSRVLRSDTLRRVLPPSILAKSAGPAAATANTAGVPLAAALMFRACGSFYDAAATRTPQEEVARVVCACEHPQYKPVISCEGL